MILSEEYKYKMQKLAGIPINESKGVEWEFQLRDIGGPVFYKRKKGKDEWQFISAEDFAENCHKGKLIKWSEKS
jgi:hypothetical protein